MTDNNVIKEKILNDFNLKLTELIDIYSQEIKSLREGNELLKLKIEKNVKQKEKAIYQYYGCPSCFSNITTQRR
ncbi:hypothetical protein [Bacillus sp. S/N-304-OC-R1]|uniref:hypothetical protein n=1 Tax=Bacillus sp. S/N-304-OC-R1 TaxID=2758034 RepID=UPI001C8CFD14|nr:hypothetical protein [Bacillus sp. S/N-304-OC-R1]MBY0122875.1 hypothetical protein [Bacillus sp. S/N-304-OC-R1]